MDVKPRPTEFGHHPIGQYGEVGQKLDFLSETWVIILKIDIDTQYQLINITFKMKIQGSLLTTIKINFYICTAL